ncbi:hypothetical protein ACHQM5_022988 [Ranunculus cassubicifolius]
MVKELCLGLAADNTNSIPVINFNMEEEGGLKEGTSSWCAIRAKVRMALETYGCFEAVYGESRLHQAMMGVIKEWFDLPLETRLKHPSNDRMKGLVNPVVPLLTNVDITDSQNRERVESFTNLIWPQGNSNFCETVHSFAKQGSKLEQTVKKMIFESFGVESYYDSLADATTYWTRFNKYRVPEDNETNVGLVKHTDSSFLSLLSQNGVNGLDIQAKDGRWITVTPSSPYSYTVLIGDPFMAWSNGRLHSPPHRVLMASDKPRYSTAFFSYIKGIIHPPEELADEKHPLLFKPFEHLGFRRFRGTEEGLKADSPIKAYCGI